jgi:hypothetical protein
MKVMGTFCSICGDISRLDERSMKIYTTMVKDLYAPDNKHYNPSHS